MPEPRTSVRGDQRREVETGQGRSGGIDYWLMTIGCWLLKIPDSEQQSMINSQFPPVRATNSPLLAPATYERGSGWRGGPQPGKAPAPTA